MRWKCSKGLEETLHFLKEGESMRSMKIARLHCGMEINTLLWGWFCFAHGNGYPISGPILQSKALSITNAFKAETNCIASNGGQDK